VPLIRINWFAFAFGHTVCCL